MRITIIPSDNFVSVDGEGIMDIDMSSVDKNIHAFQWYDSYGEIEYFDKNNRNKKVEEYTQFQTVLDLYNEQRSYLKRTTPPSKEPIWDWIEETEEWVESDDKKIIFETEKIINEKKGFLSSTDWIVVKIAEIQLSGEQIDEMLIKYSDILEERKSARMFINENEI